jgi:formylglycine-generating enzyme required for sulfatase activity
MRSKSWARSTAVSSIFAPIFGMATLGACSSSHSLPPTEPETENDGGTTGPTGPDSSLSDAPTGQTTGADATADGTLHSTADATLAETGAGPLEASPEMNSGDSSYSGDGEPPYVYVYSDASDATPPPAVPQSCLTPGPGISDCASGTGSCCAGSILPEGNVLRSYDDVTPGYASAAFPATVASFWLDQYEVTVGRFRRFVTAVVGGWVPAAGSGKHSHLNAGQGLADDGDAAGPTEPGWDTNWNATLGTTADAWNTALVCKQSTATWTPTAGANEHLPANCMTWYEAYAFCIWDGGFLPSEAEWNYAASGGTEQRVYPWSVPASSMSIDCSHANYYGASMGTDYCVMPGMGVPGAEGATNAVGSESPVGDGKWGQSDLAGNVFEWNLDYYAPYESPCSNCAYFTPTSARVIRGGAFGNPASSEITSERNSDDPLSRTSSLGVRCARAP